MRSTNTVALPMKHKTGGILVAIVLLLATGGLIMLLGRSGAFRPGSRKARTLSVQFYPDESLSMTRKLDGGHTIQQLGLAFLDDAVDSILPRRAPFKAWAFASRAGVRSLWEGQPAGAEDLIALQEWATRHPRGGEGTYAMPAFAQALAASRAAAARQEDTLIIISSDGEWNDLDKIAGLAAQIAALPNVKGIVVLPVSIEGDFRSRLDTALAPFGSRALVANAADIEQAGERLRQILNH